jgi:hypothetical protein
LKAAITISPRPGLCVFRMELIANYKLYHGATFETERQVIGGPALSFKSIDERNANRYE